MNKIEVKDQIIEGNDSLYQVAFWNFVDELTNIKIKSFNKTELSVMAYYDDRNNIYLSFIDKSIRKEEHISMMEDWIGEPMVVKKFGLPVRKYKFLDSATQAYEFYMEVKSKLPKGQNPKFIVNKDFKFFDNYLNLPNELGNLQFLFKDGRENYYKILDNEDNEGNKDFNLNGRFDVLFALEIFRNASDDVFEKTMKKTQSWILKDLMKIVLHPKVIKDANLTDEEHLKIQRRLFKSMLLEDFERPDYILHNISEALREKDNKIFDGLSQSEIIDMITPYLQKQDVQNELEKNWNKYVVYNDYYEKFKKKDSTENLLEKLFPKNLEHIVSFDFNPDEAWGLASPDLRGYYSQYRSTNEFEKIFNVFAQEHNLKYVKVFTNDYQKEYTLVVKSDTPIDELKVKDSFVNVLKIVGDVSTNPEIPKAIVWGEMTKGLSNEHFEKISELYNDSMSTSNIKKIARKRM